MKLNLLHNRSLNIYYSKGYNWSNLNIKYIKFSTSLGGFFIVDGEFINATTITIGLKKL